MKKFAVIIAAVLAVSAAAFAANDTLVGACIYKFDDAFMSAINNVNAVNAIHASQHIEVCPACNGGGICVDCGGYGVKVLTCRGCGGRGICVFCLGKGRFYVSGYGVEPGTYVTCRNCNGSRRCGFCKGQSRKQVMCSSCRGYGTCFLCGGDGAFIVED